MFIILVIILIFIYFYSKPKINNYFIDHINQINCNCDTFKSGDIILFKYYKNYIVNYETLFTHIGIVVRLDKLYILENHEPENLRWLNKFQKDVNLYDLMERINNFNGNIYLLKLKNELSAKQLDILKEKYLNYKIKIKYPENKLNYYIWWFFCNNYYRNKNILICSEFIYKILIDINILKNKNSYLLKIPDDFLYLKEYEFCGLIKSYKKKL